jgi:hypothetical protein
MSLQWAHRFGAAEEPEILTGHFGRGEFDQPSVSIQHSISSNGPRLHTIVFHPSRAQIFRVRSALDAVGISA